MSRCRCYSDCRVFSRHIPLDIHTNSWERLCKEEAFAPWHVVSQHSAAECFFGQRSCCNQCFKAGELHWYFLLAAASIFPNFSLSMGRKREFSLFDRFLMQQKQVSIFWLDTLSCCCYVSLPVSQCWAFTVKADVHISRTFRRRRSLNTSAESALSVFCCSLELLVSVFICEVCWWVIS